MAAPLDKKLSETDITKLFKMIHKSSSKWRSIGIELEFDHSELEIIEHTPSLLTTAPQSFLNEVLNKWVQWPTKDHPDTKPTLRALCTALRGSLVGLGRLADEVETSFAIGKVL